MMRGRRSERQFRALFAGCLPIDISRARFMVERRKARGRFRKKRGGLGVRSFQALNVYGVRIWADRPRFFGGLKWRANGATVRGSIERNEARAWRAVAEKWAGLVGLPI